MLFVIVLVYVPFVIVCSLVPCTKPASTLTTLNGKSEKKVEATTETPLIDIYAELKNEEDKHPKDMAYQAGINAAKAVLLPKIAVLLPKINDLKNNLYEARRQNKAHYYQILLGTREEVKHLEWTLVPLLKIPNPRSRYVRWTTIFLVLSKHPVVAAIIKRIEESGISLNQFAREMQRFYGDDSSAIHGVRLPDISVEEMKRILAAHGRRPYANELSLLTILVECEDIITNVTRSKNRTGTTEFLQELHEPRCIKLGALKSSALNETEEKIKKFFYVNNENIESIVHKQEEWGQGFYQVEFSSVEQAIYGFANHAVMLGEKSPKVVQLTHCNAKDPLPYDGQMAHVLDFD